MPAQHLVMLIEQIDRQIRAHKIAQYALDVEQLDRLVQRRDQLSRAMRARLGSWGGRCGL